MLNLKYNTNEVICKTETDHRHGEWQLVVAWAGGREGKYWEFGIIRVKLLYIEWMKVLLYSSKVLLYSIGGWIQYPLINHNGK